VGYNDIQQETGLSLLLTKNGQKQSPCPSRRRIGYTERKFWRSKYINIRSANHYAHATRLFLLNSKALSAVVGVFTVASEISLSLKIVYV